MAQPIGKAAVNLVRSRQHLSNTLGTSQESYARATKYARLLLGSSRTGEANDPEVYTAAIIAILSHYSEEVVRAVSDPYSGLTSKLEWLPKPKEVKDACEAEAIRIQRLKQIGPPIDVRRHEFKRVHWATVFVPADNARYPAMLAKSQEANTDAREFYFDEKRPGMWVISDWLPMGAR